MAPHRWQPADPVSGVRCWLVAFAVSYGVFHHQGFLFGGLGHVGFVAEGGTRIADWLDLFTPLVVLGPALMVLIAARSAGARSLTLFALGALLYVEGHGIHLAANSIANERVDSGGVASPVTHLWDEPAGHHLWFAGLALVVVALISGLDRGVRVGGGPVSWLLAAQFGLTWATNGLEGGTAIFSGLTALALIIWSTGQRRRRPTEASIPDLVLMAFVPAAIVIGCYGILQGGFPQPSEIGWGVFG